jgi:choline kinase
MGNITKAQPKCLTEIGGGETILSRQLRQLTDAGIKKIVITTGYMQDVLRQHITSDKNMDVIFVDNPEYAETNYIYSIYLAREFLHEDLLMMHGDIVMDDSIIAGILQIPASCMAVSFEQDLSEKDFKAVIAGGRIHRISVDSFPNAVYAQPVYKFNRNEWEVWLKSIESFCLAGERRCYAEEAFNTVSGAMMLMPFDVKRRLCGEIDTVADLTAVIKCLTGGGCQ